MVWEMLPWVDLNYTDPAQHLKAAAEGLDPLLYTDREREIDRSRSDRCANHLELRVGGAFAALKDFHVATLSGLDHSIATHKNDK